MQVGQSGICCLSRIAKFPFNSEQLQLNYYQGPDVHSTNLFLLGWVAKETNEKINPEHKWC